MAASSSRWELERLGFFFFFKIMEVLLLLLILTMVIGNIPCVLKREGSL